VFATGSTMTVRVEVAVRPIIVRSDVSNRSRACRNGNWKMASGDWRRKATGFRAESPGICQPETRARPHNCGNVGSSRTARNRMVETELAGWAWRIRTSKCHFERRLLKSCCA
jgi:hypothetical protein